MTPTWLGRSMRRRGGGVTHYGAYVTRYVTLLTLDSGPGVGFSKSYIGIILLSNIPDPGSGKVATR